MLNIQSKQSTKDFWKWTERFLVVPKIRQEAVYQASNDQRYQIEDHHSSSRLRRQDPVIIVAEFSSTSHEVCYF